MSLKSNNKFIINYQNKHMIYFVKYKLIKMAYSLLGEIQAN